MTLKHTYINEEEYFHFIDENNKTLHKVIAKFDIAWVGWECDNRGFIIETTSGKRHLVLTNNGRAYIASKEEGFELIKKYLKLIYTTQDALNLLSP